MGGYGGMGGYGMGGMGGYGGMLGGGMGMGGLGMGMSMGQGMMEKVQKLNYIAQVTGLIGQVTQMVGMNTDSVGHCFIQVLRLVDGIGSGVKAFADSLAPYKPMSPAELAAREHAHQMAHPPYPPGPRPSRTRRGGLAPVSVA